ncbi:LysM peptidoglycan-binding domain-containing protein [Rubeoparvulum massiliense]|uniref:LysM peptidoglycan-binding domain-containing protein n=1 Tax=Rubeoparvulum massiliense TaxID=1631346 RepID=UPI00065E7091|nr:LysM peptidoglycan-binding domain-containing protein [Rubeoparvulum massiliense]
MEQEKQAREEQKSLDLDQLMQQLRERERVEREKLLQANRERRPSQYTEEEASYAYADPLYNRDTVIDQLPTRKERRESQEDSRRFSNRTIRIKKKALYAGLIAILFISGTIWAISALKDDQSTKEANVPPKTIENVEGTNSSTTDNSSNAGVENGSTTTPGETNHGQTGEASDGNLTGTNPSVTNPIDANVGGGNFSKNPSQEGTTGGTSSNNISTDKAVYKEIKNYEVQKGDTMWSIAVKFYNNGQYVNFLQEYNNITDPATQLKAGMKIQIPTPAPPLH